MPPRRRGGAATAPKPATARHESARVSRWPQLVNSKPKKRDINITDPPISNAFLTLPIPESRLASHITQHGLPFFSQRASVDTQEQARIFAELQLKRKAAEAEKQRIKEEESHKRQEEQTTAAESQRLRHNAHSFLTLRFGTRVLKHHRNEFSWIQAAEAAQAPRIALTSQTDRKQISAVFVTSTGALLQPSISAGQTVHQTSNSGATSLQSLLTSLVTSPTAPEYSPTSATCGSLQPVKGTTLPLTPTSIDSRGQSFLRPVKPDPDPPFPPDPIDMSVQRSVDAGGVDESIKEVIQGLYTVQQYIAAFRPEQQEGLNKSVEDVAISLQKMNDQVSNPKNPVHNIRVAPEIIDYVDDGRNPDIFTRDFVELVQRGNSVINGKQKAFKDFSKVFAQALKENFDGMDDEVDLVMRDAGMEPRDGTFVNVEQNGNSA